MAENPIETRSFQLTAGLISSGTAVTASQQVDWPSQAWLIINTLAAGTTNSLALSTGTASGAGGSAVSINGVTALTGLTNGVTTYHLNDKLSKYVYASLSGTGTPTISVTVLAQGYANSSNIITSGNPTEG